MLVVDATTAASPTPPGTLPIISDETTRAQLTDAAPILLHTTETFLYCRPFWA